MFHRTAAAILILSSIACPQEKPAQPEMIVSTQWLADHLQDKNLVLIQIGPEQGEYEAGHIPGAQFLANKEMFFEHEGGLPADRLIPEFQSLGISNDSRIVIYASKYPTVATRLYWMLDYLGIAGHASLLDGGIDKWKGEHRVLSQEPVTAPKRGNVSAHLNTRVLAELPDVTAAVTWGDPILIDSRPQKRYVDGHIPGAISIYWEQTTSNDSMSLLRSPDGIRTAYEKAGIKQGSPIITYCDVGFQATHAYFTLKYLGYDVRMYDGSYHEWNGVKHMTVVTGEKPQ